MCKYSQKTLLREGCKILRSCWLMQLTKQQQLQDPDHDEFLKKMEEGRPLGMEDMMLIKRLERDDIEETDCK